MACQASPNERSRDFWHSFSTSNWRLVCAVFICAPRCCFRFRKRRYFVLSRHTKKLSYYEDETCRSLLGECDLVEAVRVGETPVDYAGFGLEIITGSRNWVFCAEEKPLQIEWLIALRRLVPDDLTNGWLFKRGDAPMFAWKRRFCRLNQNGLSVYEDENCERLVECCDLTSAFNVLMVHEQAEGGDRFGFDIVCMSPPALYHLSAETERARKRWFHAIIRFTAQINRSNQPVRSGYLVKQGVWPAPSVCLSLFFVFCEYECSLEVLHLEMRFQLDQLAAFVFVDAFLIASDLFVAIIILLYFGPSIPCCLWSTSSSRMHHAFPLIHRHRFGWPVPVAVQAIVSRVGAPVTSQHWTAC